MNSRNLGGVFISYSSTDRPIVSAAALLLRAGGATVFQDAVDIKFGARWEEALWNALGQCERVMVFWSKAAAASTWVEREWRCALRANKPIVPMLLDDTPLPAPLGEFQGVPDMLEMLRAAMRIAPDGEAVQPTITAPESQSPSRRRKGVMFATLAGSVIFTVAITTWLRLHPSDVLPPDPSRGSPERGPSDSLSGWLDHPETMLVGLCLLLIVAGLVYRRARRMRSMHEHAAIEPTVTLSDDLIALGQRFTSATFEGMLRDGPESTSRTRS